MYLPLRLRHACVADRILHYSSEGTIVIKRAIKCTSSNALLALSSELSAVKAINRSVCTYGVLAGRKCGYVVCNNCSSQRLVVPGYKGIQRVCHLCASVLKSGETQDQKGNKSNLHIVQASSPNNRISEPDTKELQKEIGKISDMELFNSLVFGSILVIDTRKGENS